VRAFTEVFTAAGGEVVALASVGEARRWLAGFVAGFVAASVGRGVPDELSPDLPAAGAEEAPLGVGVARCAVGETGSLVLDARDGRRTQLLPPVHLVWLRAADVHATLREALLAVGDDLPSALGLHSGPSKSADIGQILVRGVHGPGRLVVGLLRD
jgi:L-lactate dehydrogenase complex protein LldG